MDNQPSQASSVNPQVPNPNQVLPRKKSKLIYVFWAMLVLLILTIGATAAVYISKSLKPKATPSTSLTKQLSTTPQLIDATSWKTYQGNGFSFKYPEKMLNNEVNIRTDVDKNTLFEYFKTPITGSTYPHSIVLSVVLNRTAEQYFQGISAGASSLVKKEFKIGDVTAMMITNIPSANGQELVLIPNKSNLITLLINPYIPNGDDKEKLWIKSFDQILSTFKFTK